MNDIKEAVRDGLANHTGEFANPWIFKGSYSHELLADILNDIMASERLFKNIEALIQEQVRQARIDEIERIIRIAAVDDRNVDIRLKELKK